MPRRLPVALFALAAASPLALIGLGAAWGGPWGPLALAWMALAAVALDLLIPRSAAETGSDAEFPAAEVLLIGLGLGGLAGLPALAWALPRQGLTLSTVTTALAAGLWLGQVGHPAAHELIHRAGRAPRALGVALYTALLIGHHASAHRLVHHLHVGTPQDPNTARRGEGFWRFALRAWVGSLRAGLQAERARGRRAELIWIPGAGLALGLAFTLGGLGGQMVWLALASHAQMQILLSDYVQHYGLTRRLDGRGRAEPVGPGHSWNAGHWATSAQTLNATRHSDHHMHPSRPFAALALPPDAPRLPWPLPVAACVALWPGLWRRRIDPLLDARRPADDPGSVRMGPGG